MKAQAMGNTHLSSEKEKHVNLGTAINGANEKSEVVDAIGMKQTVSPRALLAPNQCKQNVRQPNSTSFTPGPRLSTSQATSSRSNSAYSTIAMAAVTPMIRRVGATEPSASQNRSQCSRLAVHFQNELSVPNSSAVTKNHSMTTPLNPTRKPAKVVTRSTVKNPYAKSNGTKTRTAISPVPFKFHHLSGKFSGQTISPTSMKKAAEILGDSPNTRHLRTQSFSKPRILDYSNAIVAKRPLITQMTTRLTLRGFVEKYQLALPDDHHIVGTPETIPIIFQINSSTASNLRFGNDGLPLSMDGEPGNFSGMHSELLSSGCDSTLLTQKWVANHFRWIVWKLAATERSFPTKLSGYLCRPRVLEQLKARYTKEILKSERSAVRKVLNRDESSSRLMVLCVSKVLDMPNLESAPDGDGMNVTESKSAIVELTDGWYPIRAVLDGHLSSLVSQNRICVGIKLAICNAVLHGCEDGIDPLDDGYNSSAVSSSVFLKIHLNGTKLARWSAKLGFCEQSCMKTTLMSAIPGGGSIPCMDVIVVRRYPILYLEKNDESISKILTQCQEDEAQRKYESLRQRKMEDAAEQVQNECQEEVEEQAPRIWKQMMLSLDIADFYDNVDPENRLIIDRWREKRVALMQKLKQKSVDKSLRDEDFPVRTSTPFLKIKLVAFQRFGARGKYRPSEKMAMFTLWRATDCQYNLFKEGSVIRMRDVFVKEKAHDGLLQLSSSTKTKFFSLPYTCANDPLVGYTKRKFTSIGRIYIKSKTENQSRSNEVDFMGCLVKTRCERNSSWTRVKAYFADESALLVRVEREFENHYEATQWKLRNESQQCEVFAVQDVRVMPFDSVEGCSVVSWTNSSSLGRNSVDRERAIRKWMIKEPATFAQMKGLMEAGLFAKKSSLSNVSVVIGYIVGVTACQDNSNNLDGFAFFQIDDGAVMRHILCSLPKAKEIYQMIHWGSFDQDKEGINNDSTHATAMDVGVDAVEEHVLLESIEHSVKTPNILFHFTVEQDKVAGCIRILHVRKADTRSLANLLVRSSLCSKEDARINRKRKCT